MSSSDDDEPLLANFLARHNPAKSNSSNSSLPQWIKAHQVRTGGRRGGTNMRSRCTCLPVWSLSALLS
jgi:hypothetical protein